MILFLAFFLNSALWADASGLRGYAAASKQDSRNYSGQVYEAGIEAPAKSWRLGANLKSLNREYNGGGSIDDLAFGITGSRPVSERVYFESGVWVAPDADVLPRLLVSFAPRYVLGQWDFGLALDYREYEKVESGSVHPNAIYELSDKWTFRTGIFLARTGSTLASCHGDAIWAFKVPHSLRLGVAGGDTMEDAGLQVHFNAVSAEYSYHFERWTLSLEGVRYWSDTRREDSIGVKVGWR